MKRPSVSVIVPVYNAESTITKLINQMLAQPINNIELILVNDGSTDGSLKILRTAAKDKCVTVIEQENSGTASTGRNAGLAIARGEFIMFADADDEVSPESITVMLDAIKGVDLAVCGWREIYPGKSLVRSYQDETLTSDLRHRILKSLANEGKFYGVCNKIYHLSTIQEHGLKFRTDLNFGEDLLFNLEYFKCISSIRVINQVLYKYNTSNGGLFIDGSLNRTARRQNDRALLDFAGKRHRLLAMYIIAKWWWQYVKAVIRS